MAKEKIIGLKEFRANVEKYVKEIEKGNTLVISRRSKPLFRITDVEEEEEWERVIDFTTIQKGGVDIADVLSRL